MLSTELDFSFEKFQHGLKKSSDAECAEYAIIYFCVLHFKKLDEKSSCVGFVVFYVFERKLGL